MSIGGVTLACDPIQTDATPENRMPLLTLTLLTFLSPAWAIGFAAAVGLPVLAHLLSRSRYLPVDFPGTRFVAQAVIETRRINRPRHWLLLLLRVLALAAVVGAFMQPSWDRAAGAHTAQRGECVVLILDASASMQRTHRGEPLFDHASKIAHQQLDALNPQQDRAVVILAGTSPKLLLREPSGNFTLLRSRLDAARCTYEAADLAGAVAVADAVIAEQERPGRIVILSDGQATNRPATPLRTPQSGAVLAELRVGDDSTDNIALRLLDASPYPPVGGVPLDLTVELQNYGQASADVTLHAEGGTAPTSRRLTLGPGAATTLAITLEPAAQDGNGLATFRLWLDVADGFGLDNITGLIAPVAAARPVILFTDTPKAEDSAASRIALALSPVADRSDTEPTQEGNAITSRLDVTWHRPAELPENPSAFDNAAACWVVTGLREALPEGFIEAFAQHLQAGGGGVWLADSIESRDALSAFTESPLRMHAGAAGDAVVASARFEHPALAAFEGPSRASLVGMQLAGVSEARAVEDATVLLRSADGRAVLVSRSVGRGRLIVFNADLSPARSDFASQPGFVPLINELVRYAAPGASMPARSRPGDRLPEALRAAGGQLERPALDTDAQPTDRFPAPGAYRALDRAGSPTAGVWVEIDPAESDFTPALSRSATNNGTDNVANAGPVLLDAGHARPRTVSLWPYLIAAGLLLAGAESLLLIAFALKGGGA